MGLRSLDHKKWEGVWARGSIDFIAEKKCSVSCIIFCLAGMKNRDKLLAGDPQPGPSKMGRKRQSPVAL